MSDGFWQYVKGLQSPLGLWEILVALGFSVVASVAAYLMYQMFYGSRHIGSGGAEQAYKRAFELNPGYAILHHWYAGYLRAMGRLDEALAESRQAQALDPLSPAIGRDLGRVFHCQRRYDQAIEQYRKTLELEPGFPYPSIFYNGG